MEIISDLAKNIRLPRMIKIAQKFQSDCVTPDEIPVLIHEQFNQKNFNHQIRSGRRICITCGSRGIANIDIITKSIVDYCKSSGAYPFIIPAMGSHGGATADGQRAVLAEYGITEKTMGCPILSSMETVCIGKNNESKNVFIDKYAFESDGIILCGRIKPHTNFKGLYESGLMKMAAIGLGKQYGAMACHEEGFDQMAKNVLSYGKAVLDHAPIIGGLAILENAYDQTKKLLALTTEEIIDDEPNLLAEAKESMAKIYFDPIDILIVDEIGKNYSGTGMDPNITGRFDDPSLNGGIHAKKIVVLDVSQESHGNAIGIHAADISTKRLMVKYDPEAVYTNAITSANICCCKLPMICNTDEEAIKIAAKMCFVSDYNKLRIVRIKNTLNLDTIQVSEALLEEAAANPNVTILEKPKEFSFDQKGNLLFNFS